MEFFKDVVVFTCNRLKDGPNDRVNDSDSRLPSESSIHSSVTVDKNVDFLALDTTPRVINGEEFTVTKYPKRVETEDIKEDLQRWGLGMTSKLLTIGKSSGCISTSVGSYPRMTYPSPAFHTIVFALSGARRFRVDISRRANVNTLTSRLYVTPSTPSQRTCSTV